MRFLLVVFLICSMTIARADHGPFYFFYCHITTADTALTGYIQAPYEGLYPEMMKRFRNEPAYFQTKVLADLTYDIYVHDFLYVQDFPNQNEQDTHLLYRSSKKKRILANNIRTIKLLKIIVCPYVPRSIVSKILPADTVWMKKPVVATVDDSGPDVCCPWKYLVYDKSVDYKKWIQMAIRVKNSEKFDSLVDTHLLRQHKIIAVSMCSCD